MTAARAVQSLPIADIAIGERVGFYCAEHAAQLGADIVADGQHDPIHVKRMPPKAKQPWTLIAGHHRLRGAALAGLSAIDAIEVAGPAATVEELRRLELSENLDHRRRRPIELAILVDARAKLEEAVDHPGRVGEPSQLRAARVRQAKMATEDSVSSDGWRQRTAAALGFSKKTVQRLQRIHLAIAVDLFDLAERLNFHPLGASLSAMTQLSALNPMARRAAAQMLLSRVDWPNLQAALVAAGVRESTGGRSDNNFADASYWREFNGLTPARKKVFALALVDRATPSLQLAIVEHIKGKGVIGDDNRIA